MPRAERTEQTIFWRKRRFLGFLNQGLLAIQFKNKTMFVISKISKVFLWSNRNLPKRFKIYSLQNNTSIKVSIFLVEKIAVAVFVGSSKKW